MAKNINNFRNRSIQGAVAAASIAAAIIGCGGGGGGGFSIPAPTGNAAVRSGSLGSYQSLGAGIAFPFAGVVASSPSGSTLHQMARFSPQFHGYVAKPADGNLTLVPQLNLYTDSGVISGGTETFHYFSDLAGTQPAGTMVLTSSTGSFNYATYPVTVGLKVNVTAGNLPCQGSATIKFGGPTGSNNMQGTLNLTKNNEAVSVNLNLSSNLDVDGTISISENGTTIQGTHVNGPISGDLSMNVAVSPQGFVGTGTINLDTSALALHFTNPSGASCSVDGSGNLVITYAGGTTETVSNPFSAVLLAPEGTTSGATAGTTSGSSAGTGNLSYGAGVALNAPSGDVSKVNGHSSDKKLAGYIATFFPSQGSSGPPSAAYWATPSSSVTILPAATGATSSTATSVNSSAVIVGFSQTSIANSIAVVWSSPTAKPVSLPVPTGSVYSEATGINSQGNIVGYATDANSKITALYWTGPTATTYTVLKGAPQAITPIFIQDSGKILATPEPFTVGSSVLYSSFTSGSPTVLKNIVTGGDASVPVAMNTAGMIVGACTYQEGPTVWSPPSYAPVRPMVPSGFHFGPICDLTAINTAGAFSGIIENDESTVQTWMWLPGKEPVRLSTLGITGVSDGQPVQALFDDYSIVVQGLALGNLTLTEYYVQAKTHP